MRAEFSAASVRFLVFRGLPAICAAAGLMMVASASLPDMARGAAQKTNSKQLQSYENANPIVNWTPDELARKMPELRGLEPAASQDDLPLILRKVGQNVEAFFRDFVSTTSVEEIHQTRRGTNSRVDRNNKRLNYLLLVVPGRKGSSLKEYRTDFKGNPATTRSRSGRFMLTSGFASVSIYFAPNYQSAALFHYLGRKKVNKHELLLVTFAQRAGLKDALGGFTSLEGSIPVFVQGVAWIDPAHYQIVRMRTDLLAPQPEVNLERLTTDISFREVRFKEARVPMWLPEEVNVTVVYQDTMYQNEHRYSNYKFFNVEAGAKSGGNPSPGSPK